MMLMLHHSMNLQIISQIIPFDPLVQNERNWRALSRDWNQLRMLKLLENCVASLINIKGLVFGPENLFQIMIIMSYVCTDTQNSQLQHRLYDRNDTWKTILPSVRNMVIRDDVLQKN